MLVSMNEYMAYLHQWNREVILYIDRILNNILRCSSLVMSECVLMLELGSFHRQRQCEIFIIGASWYTLPSGFRHDTIHAS